MTKVNSVSSIKNENISNEELANQLLGNLIKEKYIPFIDDIWGADLPNMQLISKFNKGFGLLLCVTNIYSKYAWVTPSKYEKGITITNAFQKSLNESNCKPNEVWLNKDSECYNRSMKSWLEEMI